MNARSFPTITPTDLNIYITGGDSNDAGRGVNSSIAGDLTGPIPGAFAPRFNSNSPGSTTWLGKLELGVNQTLIAENVSTQHGFEMRFCKSMGGDEEMMLIKYGIGSSSLLNDWHPSDTGENLDRLKDGITQAITDCKYIYRRNPIIRGFIWMLGANDAVIGGQTLSWSRSGTTITVTQASHGRSTGHRIPVYVSSDTDAIPINTYLVTGTGGSTYTFESVNSGATSGTLSYSGGLNYKTIFYDLVNEVIDHIDITLSVPVTDLRIFVYETRSGGTGFNAVSYSDVLNAEQDIGTDYLTDNPSRSSNVAGSTSHTTEGVSMSDTIHYTTSGYDIIGVYPYDYFKLYRNE